MFKKIIATLALVASASFAQWDLYPVPQDVNGSVKVSTGMKLFREFSNMPAKESHDSHYGVSFRYIFNKSLELSIEGLGVSLYKVGGLFDPDAEMDVSLSVPVLEARYQVIPMLSVFAELGLPIWEPSRFQYDYNAELGVQFGKVYENPNIISKFGVAAKGYIDYDMAELMALGEVGFNLIDNRLNLLAGASIARNWALEESDDYEIAKFSGAAWLGLEAIFNKNVSLVGNFTAGFGKFKHENSFSGHVNASVQFNF